MQTHSYIDVFKLYAEGIVEGYPGTIKIKEKQGFKRLFLNGLQEVIG